MICCGGAGVAEEGGKGREGRFLKGVVGRIRPGGGCGDLVFHI